MASILIDLAQRLSQNESKALAEMLVDSLDDETLLLGRAHRQAGFAVLKAPDVPSVLLELGYLSNRSEEHTSELQSLMRISYAVFCLKKKKQRQHTPLQHD